MLRILCNFLLIAISAASATSRSSPSPSPIGHQPGDNLHLIDLAQYPLAVCLDGTPGAFYLWESENPENRKWRIWHMGGGWCSMDVPIGQGVMVDNCYDTAYGTNAWLNWLGSSRNYSATRRKVPVGWNFRWDFLNYTENLRDPSSNPLMHDWNIAFVVYCDGGSFSGRKSTVETVNGQPLHFKGNYVLEAVIDTLLKRHGLHEATDAVVTGDGTGGLATYLHLDMWAAALPPSTFVVGMPDSGFFLDWSDTKPATAANTYSAAMRSNFHAFNASSGLNDACVAAHLEADQDAGDCYFAEHTAPFIRTPMFAMQSVVDSWQLEHELGIKGFSSAPLFPRKAESYMVPFIDIEDNTVAEFTTSTSEIALINMYRQQLVARIRKSFTSHPGHSGVFNTCLYHIGGHDEITIGGTRMVDAFKHWYVAQRSLWEKGLRLVQENSSWQVQSFPCLGEDCCGTYYDRYPALDQLNFASRTDVHV